MIKIERQELKSDSTYRQLREALAQQHRPAQHTIKTLTENRDIENFCETSMHFVEMPGKSAIYLSYECCSWFKEKHILVRIESITIYDDWNEYNRIRFTELNGADQANFPEMN
jgi:hypothetical protein